MSDKVIHTVKIDITEDDLQKVIDCLNKNEIDESPFIEEEEEKLALDEVLNNSELLEYLIVEGLDWKECMFEDLDGIWEYDGWGEVREYR